ncbi:hypothetical protein BC941DRAFT_354835, partial [Chlamydoabsidia padenii]
LAIFTVVKAGFLLSGKAGNVVVVARLPDGHIGWSAPSAIVTGAGTDVTDVVLVLNSEEAVNAFKTKEKFTHSVSIGPLGAGGSYSVMSVDGQVIPVFSYTDSKCLFSGINVEGTGLFELSQTNYDFYRQSVMAKDLLVGDIGLLEDSLRL